MRSECCDLGWRIEVLCEMAGIHALEIAVGETNFRLETFVDLSIVFCLRNIRVYQIDILCAEEDV
jgi:hypothetical protein